MIGNRTEAEVSKWLQEMTARMKRGEFTYQQQFEFHGAVNFLEWLVKRSDPVPFAKENPIGNPIGGTDEAPLVRFEKSRGKQKAQTTDPKV